MIDPKKLPPCAIVDAGVFIRSQGQQVSDPRAPTCVQFWNAMIANEKTIYVPAPVVAEVRRSLNFQPIPIPSVRWVEVAAFDYKAAMILSEKFPDQILRTILPSGPKDYIRYDAMIVACAVSNSAVLITLDSNLLALAQRANVPCRSPDFYLKSQLDLAE